MMKAALLAGLCLCLLTAHAIPITLSEDGVPVRDEVVVKFSSTKEGAREFRRLRSDFDAPSARSHRAEGFSADAELEFVDYGDIQYAFGRLSEGDLHAVQKLPGVDALYYNKVYRALQSPGGSQNNATWGLDRVNQQSLPLDGAYSWSVDMESSNVEIIIIDTGVEVTHPDWLPGQAEFKADCSFLEGKCRYDSDPGDFDGHGTHVAGTAASPTYGVAKGAKVLSMRALDDTGFGSTVTIVSAIVEATNYARKNPHKRFVINMSLGIPGEDVLLEIATANAVAAGIVVVVAAGNDGVENSCTNVPARVPEAITVGASDINDAPAGFTSYGSCVDIFAPGVDVLSMNNYYANGGESNEKSGTSMASPHVCGAAALVLALQPYLTPAEVADELKRTATVDALALSSQYADTPNLLLYTGDFASPAWPQPSAVPAPASQDTSCSTSSGVGHKLGPRGAYDAFDGVELTECCSECGADWRCRAFTFFDNKCYLYEEEDGTDVISCPSCVHGLASDAPRSPAPTPIPQLPTPAVAASLSCGDFIFGNTALAANYVGNPSGDVVYAINVTSDELFTLSTCSSNATFDTVLRFFADADLGVQLGENDDKAEHANTAGCSLLEAQWPVGTYYAVVEGAAAEGGDFSVTMQCGDDAEFAELTCGVEVSATTVDAPNIDYAGTFQPSGKVIWRVRVGAADEGEYVFNVDVDFSSQAHLLDSTRSNVLASGSQSGSGSSCGASTSTEHDITITQFLTEGDYFVVVEGEFIFEGDVSVVLECPNTVPSPGIVPPPASNQYTFEASCGDYIEGTTCGAPNLVGSAIPGTCAGDVVVELNTDSEHAAIDFSANTCTGSNYDTWLIIYTDEDLQNYITYNDDYCGLRSEISATLEPNSTYYIVVTGYDCNEGNFGLSIACEDAPAVVPTTLPPTSPPTVTVPTPSSSPGHNLLEASCGDFIEGTNVGAPNLVPSHPGTCAGDVVVEVTTHSDYESVRLGANTCNGSTYDTWLILYDDEGLQNYITYNDDACGTRSEISATVEPNSTYYVVVTGWSCREGDFGLSITCEDASTLPPPPTASPSTAPVPSPSAASNGTCVGNCGDWRSFDGCYCDAICDSNGDCCPDFYDVCDLGTPEPTTSEPTVPEPATQLPPTPSPATQGPATPEPTLPPFTAAEGTCVDHCGGAGSLGNSCYCDAICDSIGDCCPDFYDVCDLGTSEPTVPVPSPSTQEPTTSMPTTAMPTTSEPTVPEPATLEPDAEGTCVDHCGSAGSLGFDGCFCDSACDSIGDCCPDFYDVCDLNTTVPTTPEPTPSGTDFCSQLQETLGASDCSPYFDGESEGFYLTVEPLVAAAASASAEVTSAAATEADLRKKRAAASVEELRQRLAKKQPPTPLAATERRRLRAKELELQEQQEQPPTPLAATERRRLRAKELELQERRQRANEHEQEEQRLQRKQDAQLKQKRDEQQLQRKEQHRQLMAQLDAGSSRTKTKERLVAEHAMLKKHKDAAAAERRHMERNDAAVAEHRRKKRVSLLQQAVPVPVPAPGVVPVPAPSTGSLGYLHYKGLAFDENNSAPTFCNDTGTLVPSFNAINFCLLALYGDSATVIDRYPNSFSSYYTTGAVYAQHWYGGCALGSGCSSCTNNGILAPGVDWEAQLTSGDECSAPGAGNGDEDPVATVLLCTFDI